MEDVDLEPWELRGVARDRVDVDPIGPLGQASDPGSRDHTGRSECGPSGSRRRIDTHAARFVDEYESRSAPVDLTRPYGSSGASSGKGRNRSVADHGFSIQHSFSPTPTILIRPVPSGRTHLKLDILLLVLITGVAAGYRESLVDRVGPEMVLHCGTAFLVAYVFSSLLLSPDLDLVRSRPAHRWGPLSWIWVPYAWLFRHRGVSHVPVIGTLTRVAYLAATLAALAWFAALALDLSVPSAADMAREVRQADPALIVCVTAGLLSPGLLHIVADKIARR